MTKFTEEDREFVKRYEKEVIEVALLEYGCDLSLVGPKAKAMALAIFRALKSKPENIDEDSSPGDDRRWK